jgi:hypothetical protein
MRYWLSEIRLIEWIDADVASPWVSVAASRFLCFRLEPTEKP